MALKIILAAVVAPFALIALVILAIASIPQLIIAIVLDGVFDDWDLATRVTDHSPIMWTLDRLDKR